MMVMGDQGLEGGMVGEGGICRTTVANFAPICPDIPTAATLKFKFIQFTKPKIVVTQFMA